MPLPRSPACLYLALFEPIFQIVTTHHESADSVLRQPCQSFSAGLKSGKFAAGEAGQAVGVLVREVGCSHPCSFFDVRFVKNGLFFHGPKGFTVKRCFGEIGKRQN